MGYIKDLVHFRNYLAKVAKDNDIEPDEMFPFEFYSQQIYEVGYTDAYTWKLRDEPEYLRRDKVTEFIRDAQSELFCWPEAWTGNASQDFLSFAETLHRKSGVYLFESYSGEPLYIGRSIGDLGNRVIGSFKERFNAYNEQVFLRVALCENRSDAAILEVYYIAKIKPLYNSQCKYEDNPTLEIIGIPIFSERVPCFNEEDSKDAQV